MRYEMYVRCAQNVPVARSLGQQQWTSGLTTASKEEFHRRVPSDASLVGFKNCVDFHMVLDF